MGVDRVTESWSGKSGGQTRGEDGKAGSRDGQRVLQVSVTDPINDNEFTALSASGVPQIGDPHPFDFFKRCRRRTYRQLSPYLYEITCTYEGSGSDEEQNPLNEAPKIEWGPIREEEEIDTDYDGNPICTAAGEPYDPPIRIPVASRTLTITRNLPAFFEGVSNYFENTTNSSEFMGWPKGTGLITGISASSVETDDFVYWVVTVNITFRKAHPSSTDEKAWYKRVVHQGYYLRYEANDTTLLLRAVDDEGKPVTKPVLLNEDATAIVTPENTVWKEYKVHGETDFNAMGLL